MVLMMGPAASVRSGQGECVKGECLVPDPAGMTLCRTLAVEDACLDQRSTESQLAAGSQATATRQHHQPMTRHMTPTRQTADSVPLLLIKRRASSPRLQLAAAAVQQQQHQQLASPISTPCSLQWAGQGAKRSRKSRLGPAGQATPAQAILGKTSGECNPSSPVAECSLEPGAPRACTDRRAANPFAWTPEPSPAPAQPQAPVKLPSPAGAAQGYAADAFCWGLPLPLLPTRMQPGGAFLVQAGAPPSLFQAQAAPAILATTNTAAAAVQLHVSQAFSALPANQHGMLDADALNRLASDAYLASARNRAARRLLFVPNSQDALAAGAGVVPFEGVGVDPAAVHSGLQHAVYDSDDDDGPAAALSPAVSHCGGSHPTTRPLPPSAETEAGTPRTPLLSVAPHAPAVMMFDPTEAHTLGQLAGLPAVNLNPKPKQAWPVLAGVCGSPAHFPPAPAAAPAAVPAQQLDTFLSMGLRVRVARKHTPLPPDSRLMLPAASPAVCC